MNTPGGMSTLWPDGASPFGSRPAKARDIPAFGVVSEIPPLICYNDSLLNARPH